MAGSRGADSLEKRYSQDLASVASYLFVFRGCGEAKVVAKDYTCFILLIWEINALL